MLSRLRALQSQTLQEFVWFWVRAVLLFVILMAIVTFYSQNEIKVCITSSDPAQGAKEALGLLKDTTVWLASIQTATLAALGLITKDGFISTTPTQFQVKLAILVALMNSSALFFSAWILTALPTVMLRVYSNALANYDFYNLPIYDILPPETIGKVLRLQFFSACNHWLWAFGVILFGWLCISMAISRSQLQSRIVTD